MNLLRASIQCYRMKHLLGVLLTLLVVGVFLTGCQGTMMSTSAKGQTIQTRGPHNPR